MLVAAYFFNWTMRTVMQLYLSRTIISYNKNDIKNIDKIIYNGARK